MEAAAPTSPEAAALRAESWDEFEVAASRHATFHWAADSVLRLDDADVNVRQNTMEALGRLPMELLATHEAAIVEKLEDSDDMVRLYATIALLKLPVEVLASHAAQIAARLDDPNRDVRKYAMAALGRAPPKVLATHQTAIAKTLLSNLFFK